MADGRAVTFAALTACERTSPQSASLRGREHHERHYAAVGHRHTGGGCCARFDVVNTDCAAHHFLFTRYGSYARSVRAKKQFGLDFGKCREEIDGRHPCPSTLRQTNWAVAYSSETPSQSMLKGQIP